MATRNHDEDLDEHMAEMMVGLHDSPLAEG